MTGVQTCDLDRKSTRLNSSHTIISYAVFCLKKKSDRKSTRLNSSHTIISYAVFFLKKQRSSAWERGQGMGQWSRGGASTVPGGRSMRARVIFFYTRGPHRSPHPSPPRPSPS